MQGKITTAVKATTVKEIYKMQQRSNKVKFQTMTVGTLYIDYTYKLPYFLKF